MSDRVPNQSPPGPEVPAGEDPRRNRTLFVSSRMEELALERRAAFDAVYLAGFVPLLFETEPRGDSEKAKIDTLVDSSEYYLGLYYQTIGSKNSNLCYLEPIRYELYRFLLRFHDREILELLEKSDGTVNEEVRKVLDRKLEDGNGALRDLHRDLAAGELDDLLDRRVLLFRKVQSYDSATSVSLEMLLAQFGQCQVFQSRRRETPDYLAEFTDEESFQTARFDFFRQALKELHRWHHRATTSSPGPGPAGAVASEWWRLQGPDLPGIVFATLRSLFLEGLNIQSLCVGAPLDGGSREDLIIDVVATPFYPSERGDFVAEALAKVPHMVARKKPETSSRKQRVRPLTTKIAYAIETADVPGMALRIVERIMRYDASIEAYFLDTRRRELYSPIGFGAGLATHLVAISSVEVDGKQEQPPWGKLRQLEFEADLKQGMGIMQFSRIPPREFNDRVRELSAEDAAG